MVTYTPPKGSVLEGKSPAISGKSRLVKYYSIGPEQNGHQHQAKEPLDVSSTLYGGARQHFPKEFLDLNCLVILGSFCHKKHAHFWIAEEI